MRADTAVFIPNRAVLQGVGLQTEVEMLHEHSPHLRAALDYAAAGQAVLALIPRSKEPAIARGFHSATSNP